MNISSLLILACVLSFANALKGDGVTKGERRRLKKHSGSYYAYSSGRGGVSKWQELNNATGTPPPVPSTSPSSSPSVQPQAPFAVTFPTPAPVTPAPSSQSPSVQPQAPSFPFPTLDPATVAPITPSPVDVSSFPATSAPASASPASASPASASPVSAAPVTVSPIAASPMSASPVTGAPNTPTPETATPSSNPPSSAPSQYDYSFEDPPRTYTTVGSPTWPSDAVWQAELAPLLSLDATLYNNIDFATDATLDQLCIDNPDPWDWIEGGRGMCMIYQDCHYQFCNWDGKAVLNTPAYTVDVRTPEDISAAIQFAETYNIQVTVKTTGHNWIGSAIHRDSINIWMANYPKDGTITEDFVDSCGTVTNRTIGINGGELWNDVLNAIKDDYHVVAGSTRSVSAAGGWLQGIGLSFTSRQFGVGVDNVIRFEVVLPNGEVAAADACENPDLFWALRGGGGGTFGVVTHVDYTLHPRKKIMRLEIYTDALTESRRLFLEYWINKTPYLGPEVGGAWWGPEFAELFFVGDDDIREVAYASFLTDFDYYLENTLWEADFGGGWRWQIYDSWYDAMGGENATDAIEEHECRECEEKYFTATRLIPQQSVIDDPGATITNLLEVATSYGGFSGYWLGGAVNDVSPHATAVHPATRQMIYSLSTGTKEAAAFMRQVWPNDVTGASINHHAADEPEWRTALWGDDHYQRLLGIKNRYDPSRRLNCWHSVGYQGEEYEAESFDAFPTPAPPSPSASMSPSTSTPSFSPTEDPPVFYTVVGDPSWPADSVWQNELASLLSSNATLFNNLGADYEALCYVGGPLEWITEGQGICVIHDDCHYRFCNLDGRKISNTPAYTVDVRSPEDIAAALKFAETYKIQVTIKTTGHNWIGSAMIKDSLNIWMTHYPKDDTIQQQFTDSCGTVTDHSIGVNGGELWNDVFEAMKRDYHVLSGDTRSVSAAGGWLQGVGLSHTSRQYGLGIDNVLRFEVVLPTGEIAAADACENPDLFWALRGGGGGTFGVVTRVDYKLLPPTKVVRMNLYVEPTPEARRLFLEYWVAKTPYLKNEVAGAWWGPDFAEIFFVGNGNQTELINESFLNDYDDWLENVLRAQNFTGNREYKLFESWYDAMGGENETGVLDGGQCRGCDDFAYIATRLIPQQMVIDDPTGTVDILHDIAEKHSGFGAYWLGGAVNDVPADATAVHPAMREAIYGISTYSVSGARLMRQSYPNDVTGCSFNHHGVAEPEWRTALWGDEHYQKLLDIKNKYDPNRRLNCWHCVGYQGEEFDENEI